MAPKKQRKEKTKPVQKKKTVRHDFTFIPIAAGIVLIFTFPLFWVRTAGYALFISGTGWWALQNEMRRQGALFSAFVFAYIVSPYWRLPLPGMVIPGWLLVVVLIILAFYWAVYHASESENNAVSLPGLKEIFGWLGLFVFWGLIQFNGFFVDIPWRGDEDSHFNHSTSVLVSSIKIIKDALETDTFFYFPLAGLLFFAIAFLLRWGFRKYGMPGADKEQNKLVILIGKFLDFLVYYGWIAGVAAVWCIKGYDVFPNWQYRLLRYPFAGIWAATLPGWDIGGKVLVEPWWLRIAPFSCFWAGAGIVFSWVFRKTREWLSSFLAGCAVLTMPLVLNYGSMYILEPFIFPLSLAVFLYPAWFSLDNAAEVRKTPQNSAFCMLLLLKETAFPMLGVAGVMRAGNIVKRIINGDKKLPDLFMKETIYMVMLCVTVLPYLMFRIASGLRGYSPNFSNLFRLDSYTGYAAGLWEQTGLVILFAVAGGVVLAKQKKAAIFFPLFLLIVIYMIFFTLDGYPGYGRFNFMLLPGIVSLFLFGLLNFRDHYKHIVPVILCCVIGVNFLLSPFDVSSGVTKPLWERRADFENETTYYPISETVSWLKKNHQKTPVMLYVHDYRFVAFEWAASSAGLKYLPAEGRKRDIRKAYKEEKKVLPEILYEAKIRNIPLVGYLCLNGPQPPDVPENALSGYKLLKLFKNPYRAIALYSLE